MPEQPRPRPHPPDAPEPKPQEGSGSEQDLDKYESAGGTRSVVVRPTSGLLRRRGTWAAPIGPKFEPNPELVPGADPNTPVASPPPEATAPEPAPARASRRFPRPPDSPAETRRSSQRVRRSRALQAMPELAGEAAEPAQPSRRLSSPVVAARPGDEGSAPLRIALLALVLIGVVVAVGVLAPARLEDRGPRLAVGGPPLPPAVRRSRIAAIWSAVHQGEDPAELARSLAPLGEVGVDELIALALRDGDKPAVAARALALLRRLEARVEFRALCRLMRDDAALGAAAAERAAAIDDPELWALAEQHRAANPRLAALLGERAAR